MTRAYATFETDRRVCRAADAWMQVSRDQRRAVIAVLDACAKVDGAQRQAWKTAASLLRSTRAWGTP